MRKLILSIAFLSMSYLVISFSKFVLMSPDRNAYYAIHSNEIEKPWGWLPCAAWVNKKLFENASPQSVQQGFHDWGETLFGIATGWRLEETQLNKEQLELAQQLTIIAHSKGVGYDWISSNGCRALNDAVVLNHIETARFLARIGGEEIGKANPASKIAGCRINAYVLAAQRGIDLQRAKKRENADSGRP